MEIFLIKRGATLPVLRGRINTNISGNLVDAASLVMRLKSDVDSTIVEYTCTIDDTTMGDFHYQFADGETNTPGIYWGELWVSFNDGTLMKVPNDPSESSWFNVKIEDDNS